eukprot:2610989-Prymnesium_polylepis.2
MRSGLLHGAPSESKGTRTTSSATSEPGASVGRNSLSAGSGSRRSSAASILSTSSARAKMRSEQPSS